MNGLLKRVVTVLVSLVIIGYVGYQAYNALYRPIRTMRAQSGTYEDIIKAEGVVLHQETIVPAVQGGVVDYVRSNGEDVAKGGEIAYIYRTEQDAANRRRIQAINALIAQYEQMGDSTSAESIDIDVLSAEIENSFSALCAAADGGKASDIAAAKADMLSLLNKKQLATGEITNFNAQIAGLEAKAAALAQTTGDRIGTIYAPEAGYFVSETDGFENAYNYADVPSITAADVEKLLARDIAPQKGAAGKIISNYESYIVCTMDANDAYDLHVGDSVQLRFLLSSQPSVTVTVAAINRDLSGVAVAFKCTEMTSSLAVIRRQDMEIVANSYTGIEVPDGFMHVVGGVKGVFVREGSIAQFKKLDAVYSAAGYTVSAINADPGYLQVYDEIIENGDDLYDGEIIK
jgi:hypothetical protein